MDVCQESLELNGRLISTDQLLYHDELKNKFQMAQASVSAVLRVEERVRQQPLCSLRVMLLLCNYS